MIFLKFYKKKEFIFLYFFSICFKIWNKDISIEINVGRNLLVNMYIKNIKVSILDVGKMIVERI